MTQQYSSEKLESLTLSTTLLGAVLVAAIVLFGAWASLSKLDVVSIAQGSIIPTSKVQKLQHLEGGIIQKIHVKEGQRVKAGESLVVLSSATNEADVGEIHQRINALQADVVRLEAESAGLSRIAFTPELIRSAPKLVARAKKLFAARRARLETDIAVKQSDIQQRTEEAEEIRVRKHNSERRLKLVREQIRIGERLLENNLSNRYEHIELLKEANTLQSAIDEDTTALRRSQAVMQQAQDELEKVQRAYNEEVQSALTDARQSLDEIRARSEKYEDSLDRTILRAPVSGIVKRLYVVTEGGVIRAGDTVLDIVPEDDSLIIEAQLAPQDIGYIQLGQYAFVQLDSADAARLGKIEGVVKHISPDSVVDSEGQPYYIVHIEVNQSYFGNADNKIYLFPGMIVSAGIVLGQRSVLEYLLSPFSRSAAFVFTEL